MEEVVLAPRPPARAEGARSLEVRFVEIGAAMQSLLAVVTIGYGLLEGVRDPLYWVPIVLAFVSVPIAMLLPWDRFQDELWLAWGMITVDLGAAATLGCVMYVTGGARSPLRHVVLAFAVYVATAYPRWMARVVLSTLFATYAVVWTMVTPRPRPAVLVVELAIALSIAGVVRYVTARLGLEEQARQRLADLDELRRHVVETASHELRTPVTIVAGLAKTLAAQGDRLDAETRATVVDRLDRNATSLVQVVDVLLDLERLQSGVFSPALETVQICELLEDCRSRLADPLAGHPVSMDLEPHAVRADPILLSRVLDNLLVNVARHTPDGTPVHVGVHRVDDAVVVRIEDGGPGIAPERLRQLGGAFDRAGRTSTVDDRGLGLGLPLVAEMLAAHGSSLRLASGPGLGTRVTFALAPG